MLKTIIIFGYGYVSHFLAPKLAAEGWLVYVTSRTVQPSHAFPHSSVNLISFFDAKLADLIKTADAFLSTVPPVADHVDPVLAQYTAAITASQARWLAYLSATSVYGDHSGAWVDETSDCRPSNAVSQLRWQAEQRWLAFYSQQQRSIHVFRLSGIYGPGRNCLEQIKVGKRSTIVKADHWFSRIHVADIYQALLASLAQPTPGEVYNLSDDEPTPLHLVQQFAARLLQQPALEEIPYEQAVLSERARQFFEDNKRVNSQKILTTLDFQWHYPNYRVGLSRGC